MIYGACHTPISEIRNHIVKHIVPTRLQIVDAETHLAHRRVFIVTSVNALRAHAKDLSKYKSTIIVIDTYPELKTIDGLIILDSPVVDAHEYMWSPGKFSTKKLYAELQNKVVPPTDIKYKSVDIFPNLITQIKDTGLLDKVLTFLHKIQDKELRQKHQLAIHRYMIGDINLKTITRKLEPVRKGTSLYESYEMLIAAFSRAHGLAVRDVLMHASPKFESSIIEQESLKHKIDPYEARYLAHAARKMKVDAK